MPPRHAIVAAWLLLALVVPANAECPPCGPLYCLDDPSFPSRLQAKKTKMTQKGYPSRLVALLDRLGKCVACVDNSPDGFTLQVVANDGTWQRLSWSQDGEDLAKRQLQEGKIRAYYIMNAAEACPCCKEKKAQERPDWDPELDLNRDVVLVFKR